MCFFFFCLGLMMMIQGFEGWKELRLVYIGRERMLWWVLIGGD